MNFKQYNQLLNNIQKQAPLESGVQALVYMLLVDVFDNSDRNVLIIDNMSKKSQYLSLAGISDIAIVKKDFVYDAESRENDGIEFCIEVKATNENLAKYDLQYLYQVLTYGKGIITNGFTWRFCDISRYISENADNVLDETMAQYDYSQIKDNIDEALSIQRDIKHAESSLAHTKKEEDKNDLSEYIKTKTEEFDRLEKNIKSSIDQNQLIGHIIEESEEFHLQDENGLIDKEKYIELVKRLYDLAGEYVDIIGR